MDATRFAFNLMWYDQIADLHRPYQLFVYHYVNDPMQIEMYDTKTNKIFLRRIAYTKIQFKDIYVGNIIDIYGRQMKVDSYGDEFTRKSFQKEDEKTITYIGYDNIINLGKIISLAESNNLKIINLRMLLLNNDEITKLCNGRIELVSLLSKPFVIIELLGSICFDRWIDLLKSFNIKDIYTNKSLSESLYDHNLLFNNINKNTNNNYNNTNTITKIGKTTALYDNCTCCVIKPHCFIDSNVGNIINSIINEGYEISAIELFRLNFVTAEEFYQVYKGVKPDFTRMVEIITCGPCIAMEIRAENAVDTFRDFCGPQDYDLAKMLRPNTLRGKYGKDNLQNAVHCTDLPQDGVLESDYFFNIMQHIQQQ